MPFSREDRRVQNSKQDKIVFLKTPPSSTSMTNGTQAVAILPNKQLGYYIKQRGSLWSTYFTNDGNQIVDKNLEIKQNLTVDNNLIVNSNVGIGARDPGSLLEVRGGTGTGFTGAGKLTLSTAELTIVDNDILGVLAFQAPKETGADAILPSAAIWGESEATFDATNNDTALVFATANSETVLATAQERMRIDSSGNVGIGVSAPEATLSITSGYHVIAVEQDIRYAHSGDNTAIVELSNVKIPAKAIITRIVAVVKELSDLATHEVNIQMSTTSGVNPDAADSFTELLGDGVANTDSTDSTSASDISMGTSASDLKDVWICRNVVRNGTSDQYIYVCNAGGSNGTTDSTAGTLVIILEYYGMD